MEHVQEDADCGEPLRSTTALDHSKAPSVPQAKLLSLTGSTLLEQAFNTFRSRLPGALWRKFASLLFNCLPILLAMQLLHWDSEDKTYVFPMGSACSGCDITMVAWEVFFDMLARELGLRLRVSHAFACEIHSTKRRFLHSQFDLQMLIPNVNMLGGRRAQCVLHNGLSIFVPWVFAFQTGFSCKSRSTQSSKSSTHKHCIQTGQMDAETCYTWSHVWSYIKRALPMVVILENVRLLLEKALDESSRSDAEFIIEQFQELGYYAIYLLRRPPHPFVHPRLEAAQTVAG